MTWLGRGANQSRRHRALPAQAGEGVRLCTTWQADKLAPSHPRGRARRGLHAPPPMPALPHSSQRPQNPSDPHFPHTPPCRRTRPQSAGGQARRQASRAQARWRREQGRGRRDRGARTSCWPSCRWSFWGWEGVCVQARVCVRSRVRACVCVCMRACVCVCVVGGGGPMKVRVCCAAFHARPKTD